MTDFSKPRHMAPAAFFIVFIKSLKTIIGAVLIFALLNIKSIMADGFFVRLAVSMGAVAGIALLIAAAAFFPKKFSVNGGNLIFAQGIVKRESMTIPLSRVHSLRTRRGIWYRLLGLRGIVFDTVAFKGEEIELILSEADWNSLLKSIEREEAPRPQAENVPPPYNPSATRAFDNSSLLKDALCQNHLKGFAILGSAVAALYNLVSDAINNHLEEIAEYAESHMKVQHLSLAYFAVSLVVVYAAVLVLWTGKVMLRYYDMTLTYGSKLLSFNYGLLSKSSCRFAYDKICTIRVKRNFLEKRFGLATLILKQALNVSAQKEEDNMRIYGEDSSAFFLQWWLGKNYVDSAELIASESGMGTMTRIVLPWLVIALGAAIALWSYDYTGLIIIPALCVAIAAVYGYCTMRRSKIVLRDGYAIICNGHFADVKNYVKYANVEVVGIRKTPFTRLFHRVALVLSTSGTSFVVRSLKEGEADQIRKLLLAKIEKKNTTQRPT